MAKRIGRWAGKAGCMVLLLCLCGSAAFADFTVAGSTTGHFSLGFGSVLGLSFGGSSFSTTGGPVSLGTFNLSTLLGYYDPFDFVLSVNFTSPSNAGTVFRADMNGLVSIFGGSATINFRDNSRHFDNFDLYISDITVGNRSSATLTGTISSATFASTPEPSAIALTGALLGGVLILLRKRLRDC